MAFARNISPLRFVQIVCVLGLAALAACSSKPPKPTELGMSFEASANINPDLHGRASPVVVRFYQLKNLTAFNTADFFSLYERDQDVLAADLISKEEFQFTPGDKKQFTRQIPPEMCCIAVFAAFRDLEHA
ncbi:MAG TPA: type VI secretion system lipoprotein TssJ, partial [Pseudomonadales bacterium]|nr:type VI secretion system lipoprotein TssJ [Pseudomonadales bacterium]